VSRARGAPAARRTGPGNRVAAGMTMSVMKQSLPPI
jgi:hypothetical protein